MNDPQIGTILVVCNDEDYSRHLIGGLHEIGASVVGPVSRANMALALAAQTSPSMAIVTHPLTGRRDAETLAQELHDTWGVRSVVLDEAMPEAAPSQGEQPWRARPSEIARLQTMLAGLGRGPAAE